MTDFTATWLGDGSPEAQIITEGGLRFVKGEPTRVPGDLAYQGLPWAENIRNNPMFEVGTADEDDLNTADDEAEMAELRSHLDALGVRYNKNASAATLRSKLDEATK